MMSEKMILIPTGWSAPTGASATEQQRELRLDLRTAKGRDLGVVRIRFRLPSLQPAISPSICRA